jgi:TonB family protein
MSAPPAEPPLCTAPPGADAGWSRRKWLVILALAVAAHLGLVFLLGAGKAPGPRPVVNAPHFHLATGDAELMALTDPTLFVRPHEAADFLPAGWRVSPDAGGPAFAWSEPAPSLSPATNNLGALFAAFLQTNEFAILPLDFKPKPRFVVPVAMADPALPQRSTMQISGGLARRLVETPTVPGLAGDDILQPNRVQVLVDENGSVASAVLLESSENEAADRQALAIARALRFQPATGVVFGELTFRWHIVPTNAP